MKAVRFAPEAPAAMFAYAELGWLIVTPAVEELSVAEMPVAVLVPVLLSETLRSLHSLKSMVPLPLPPEIVAEANSRLAPGPATGI